MKRLNHSKLPNFKEFLKGETTVTAIVVLGEQMLLYVEECIMIIVSVRLSLRELKTS